MKTFPKVMLAMLGGIAVGAAIGVLFAPDKGIETRKKISENAKRFGEKAKNKFRTGIRTAQDMKARMEEEAEELV